MIDFKQILFPVDMSEQDRQAAPFVKAMARRFGSEIVMLYVEDLLFPAYTPTEYLTPTAFEIAEQVQEQRRAEFQSFLTSEFAGARFQRTLVEGDAAVQIVAYAKKNEIGLIMLPTHGYGPFRRFLLGSVTAKVLHDFAGPVWTGVHTLELLSHDPERCERLLCAVDIDSRDARVVRWAAEFAGQQHCDVQLVHAIQGAKSTDDDRDRSFREFLFKFAHERISELQKEAGISFPVTLRGGKPEHIVHDVAQDLKADLVVIGRGDLHHPLGRLRTHAYSIIRESACPVISV